MPKNPRRNKTKNSFSFGEAINRFTHNIDCLIFSLPLVMRPVIEEQKEARQGLDDFLKKNAKTMKSGGYAVKFEDAEAFESLLKKSRNVNLAVRTVPRSLFISLVSYFDHNLRDLLKITFEKKQKELLNSTERKISVLEILELNSPAEAKEFLINREIDSLMVESRLKCIDWLEAKFKIKFNFSPTTMKAFIELTERRNLFVHSDGVVTNNYLNTCKKHGISIDKSLKLGDKLTIDPKYFYQSCWIVYALGVQFSQVLWRNIEPENLEKADLSLLNMTAELIDDGNNGVAGRLLDFADQLKNYSSEKLRLMLMINRALAMKFGNAGKKACKLVNAVDWSAAENDFKLAVAIIKDREEEAAKIMLDIGASKEMKMNYKEWPLFKEFKKTKLFQATYQEIFKESFIVESGKIEEKADKDGEMEL